MRLRVLVYNVRGFRHGVEQVLAVTRDLAPDIALITECGTRRVLRRFAREMGMQATAGELPWVWRRAPRNAVLVRAPLEVDAVQPMRFSSVSGVKTYPRGATVTTISREATPICTAVCLHLGLVDGERPWHARELLAELDENPLGDPSGRFLVGGDLNELPGGPAVVELTHGMRDVWTGDGGETYPAREPDARIDYLFAHGFTVAGVRVIDEAPAEEASDHLALLADVLAEG